MPYPDTRPDLAIMGALLADPGRAAMLWSLMDGQRRPAGELARIAGLSPQAASAQFTKLLDGGLIAMEAIGRWRYYRLAGASVAELIERLASFVGDERPSPQRRVARLVPAELRFARSCYDHLAGRFALQLLDRFRERAWVVDRPDAFGITPAGRLAFGRLGVDVEALERMKRGLARRCMDWTERLPHLAGTLGAAILAAFLERGWMARIDGGRALRLTHDGEIGIAAWLDHEAAGRVAALPFRV
jgi:DNA-binding transcriptional ArsR family regulator